MGHRPEIERPLLDILKHLRSGGAGPKFAFLHGPRGNGKTVLLTWLRRQAMIENAVPCAYLIPEDLESDESLAHRLASATLGHGPVMRIFPYLNIGLSMDLVLDKVKADINVPENFVAARLGNDSLLILMDEAHTASPDRLKRIMGAVQVAGADTRIALVMAGTPGLEDVLRSASVSYWSRGEKLRVGRLSASEAEVVIAEPFKDAGIRLVDGAAADLAATADHYPYFLQVYGALAWESMVSTGSGTLDATHVAIAKADGVLKRRDYYRDRYEEFVSADALPLARGVALAFGKLNGAFMRNVDLHAVLDSVALDGWNLPRKLHFLRSRGFIWNPAPDVDWEPGIPSLMEYMIKETH